MLNLCLKLENLWSKQSSQIAGGYIQLVAGRGLGFKAVCSQAIPLHSPTLFSCSLFPSQTG